MHNVIFMLSSYLLLSNWITPPVADAHVATSQNVRLDPTKQTEDSESRFLSLIAEAVQAFAPEADAFGAKFSYDAYWDSDTINGTARRFGDDWKIIVWGGLFRVEGMSEDGFLFTVCHEIGHLMGGFPFYTGGIGVSSEGQADYFAAQVCLRRMWMQETKINAAHFLTTTEITRGHCQQMWEDEQDVALCSRIVDASFNAFSALDPIAEISQVAAETSEVEKTKFTGYPTSQCRFDNTAAAAICPFTTDLWPIPGFIDDQSPNNSASEEVALRHSCSLTVDAPGARRPCWFKEGSRP